MENNELEKKEIKVKLNLKNELEKINTKTIFEFKKTMENFDLEKVKIYKFNDNEKTVTILFYDNDFFAMDRVNYPEGHEYDLEKESAQMSENLNYKIKKIPNVSKTRKILKIEDIETRIYDVSEYIILLKKENVKVLRVNSKDDLEEIKYEEYKLNLPEVESKIEEYEKEEQERFQEENSIKNKMKKIAEKARDIIIEPFRILKNKLMKANQVKMLSDGKHSIFDKED